MALCSYGQTGMLQQIVMALYSYGQTGMLQQKLWPYVVMVKQVYCSNIGIECPKPGQIDAALNGPHVLLDVLQRCVLSVCQRKGLQEWRLPRVSRKLANDN